MLYYHLILCWPLSPFAFNLSGYFPKSQPFASGGQSIRVSASVLPMNIQDWFPLRCTDWVSLLSKGLSRVFSSTTISKASILWCSTFFMVQLSHPHMTTAKTIGLTIQIFVGKVMSLLFIMLFRFVTAFLPRSKHLLISRLQSPCLGAQENKICHCFHFFPFYLPWSDRTVCHDLSFLIVEF